MTMGDRLQSLRKKKGISQEELADIIGVSRQAVSKWENQQSIPDLDKIIIMSEFFEVTTDYILKGAEGSSQLENGNSNTSQILYIASTAFLAIGLLCAFGGWYTEQSAESIWGSMIIQVVGVVAYFIGKLTSTSKVPFIINWFNIIILLFIPISLIITAIRRGIIAPYPTDIITGLIFAIIYMAVIVISFFALNKQVSLKR